jgi:hypothetical protein
MKKTRSLVSVSLIAIIVGCRMHAGVDPLPGERVTEYRNGWWFDGTVFSERSMYVVGSVFRERRPSRVDSVVDLGAGYVVPPFADAHQHLFDPGRASEFVARMLRDGIFYVKEQSSSPFSRQVAERALSGPRSVDLISANQGWTSPGGHPVEVVQRGAQIPGPVGAFVRDSMDPALVMQVATREDVDRRWAYFLAGRPRPDFVKVFLFRSDEYARWQADPKMVGNRGMDPTLVPYIVSLAHAAGLRVSAHVFTAADFRNALDAGVDDIAHLPGGRGTAAQFLLTDADAARAADRHVTIATTVVQHGDSALTDRLVREQYAHNIRLLRAHGVPLLIGSDLAEGTAATEIAALSRSGLFTNLELLRLWSVVTPQTIFPARKIGRLGDGYEASFLVLRADPIANIANTRQIVMRVKRGLVLNDQ